MKRKWNGEDVVLKALANDFGLDLEGDYGPDEYEIVDNLLKKKNHLQLVVSIEKVIGEDLGIDFLNNCTDFSDVADVLDDLKSIQPKADFVDSSKIRWKAREGKRLGSTK